MEQWKYDKEEDAERLYIDDIPQFKYRKRIVDKLLPINDFVETFIEELEPYKYRNHYIEKSKSTFSESYAICHYNYYTKKPKLTTSEIDIIKRALEHYSDYLDYDKEYDKIVSKLEALRNEQN